MIKNNKLINSKFDGHLEKRIKDMNPKEKLDYIANHISLYYYIKNKVKTIK